MKPVIVLANALAFALAGVAGDAVGNGQTTNAITFGGFPGPYTFQRASSVNYNNGNPTCPLETVSTDDGPLAPLTSEMHYIFRGPLNLLQFAVYQPSSGSSSSSIRKKRGIRETTTERRHRFKHHAQMHGHGHGPRARGYGDEVTATIDGQVTHFEDTWDPPDDSPAPVNTPATPTSSAVVGYGAEVTATINGVVVSFEDTWDTPVASIEAPSPSVVASPNTVNDPTTIVASSISVAPSSSMLDDPATSVASSVSTIPASPPEPSTTTFAVSGATVLSEVNNGQTTYSSPISIICESCEPSDIDQTPTPSLAALPPPATIQSATSPTAAAPTSSEPSSPTSGAWSRASYFDAASQTAENIAFTANNNMTIEDFGFLPGWVAQNGQDKADGPSLLGTTGFISDNYEVLVHTSSLCTTGDNSGGCSVVTPGAIAHHGWSGDRIVLAEYTMPQSACGSNCTNHIIGDSDNTNLPAIWSLASTTVNIGQYGFSWSGSCTGWNNGAGELDIHEVLPGAEPSGIGYASLHMDNHYSGTPPQGFVRPDTPGKSMKIAIILSGSTMHIQVLGQSAQFGEGIDDETVQGWINGSGAGAGPSGVSGNFAVVDQDAAAAAAPAYVADMPAATFNVLTS